MQNYLENKSAINVFDVCGTLYSLNTTFSFISFFHKKNNSLLLFICVYFLTSKLGKFFALFFRFSIRKIIITTLKGCEKKTLNRIAEDFYDEVLRNKKNQIIFNYFEKTQNKVLLSASITPIIDTIAKRLNCKFESTSLKYDNNNICLGEIFEDVKGNKLTKIGNKKINEVFTDNLDDVDIINNSNKAYLVFSSQKRKSKWDKIVIKQIKIDNIEYLKI